MLTQLEAYLRDPRITDIVINGSTGLWRDSGAGFERDDHWESTEEQVRALARTLISAGGRHIDEAHPCVDVRLARGIRAHAILSPVSRSGTSISLRIPRQTPFSLDAWQEGGGLSAQSPAGLRALVASRRNVLISGASGTGKTTLLAALLGEVAQTERIVIIEDLAELQVAHPHVVSLEARQPNLEGVGGIDVATLIREALRMRPDRLIVGECRGAEIAGLLMALNTGHSGGAGTIHANSLADVPTRLEALGALAGLSIEALTRQAASAIDVVIHVEKIDGVRKIADMGRLVISDAGTLSTVSTVDDFGV
jgi:pilus assembly protein CpaF